MMCGKLKTWARWGLWAAPLCAALVLAPAPAQAALSDWHDGNLSTGWGLTNTPGGIDNSALAWGFLGGPPADAVVHLEDNGTAPGGFVDPAYGGQNFDAEFMIARVFEDSGTRYLAIAISSGTDPRGESLAAFPGQLFLWGDIFLDFGGNGTPSDGSGTFQLNGDTPATDATNQTSWTFDTAIRVQNLSRPANTLSTSGGTAQVWGGPGTAPQDWWNLPGPQAGVAGFPGVGPFSVNTGDPDATHLRSDVSWTWVDGASAGGNAGASDHNILEILMPLSNRELGLLDPNGSSIGIFWTIGCGNDVVYVEVPTPPGFPPDIPEPSTLALLGLGVAAGVVRRRFVRK